MSVNNYYSESDRFIILSIPVNFGFVLLNRPYSGFWDLDRGSCEEFMRRLCAGRL